MQINLNVPEEIARNFGEDVEGIERAALESLAIQGVRSGKLSRGQATRLLGFPTTYELDGFLKANGIPVQESIDEILKDAELVLALGRQ